MRALKILFTIIAIFVAVIVAAPFFLEPNDFKDEIAGAVEDATGRKLAITGDLELSIFPWLGVSTGALEVGNRSGFSKTPFATISTAQIRVKLLPLLSKKVEMDSLVLTGLNLNLERLKNGQDNWSDLSKKPADETKKESTPSDAPKLAALAIGGVTIDKANIRFQDALAKQDVKLTDLSLQTGPLELGAPVDIQLTTQFFAKQPAVNGSLQLDTQLQANPFDGTYLLKDSHLNVDIKGKQLPAGRIKGTLDATIAANLIKQTLTLSGMKLVSDPLNVSGQMSIAKMFAPNPGLNGKIKVAGFNPKTLFKKLAITVPDTADPGVLKQASFDTDISGSLENIKLKNLKLILDDSLIQGDISLGNKKRKTASYNLDLDRIDLDRYLPATPKQASNFGLIPVAIATPQAAPLFPVDLLRSFDMSGNVKAGQLIMNRLLIENIDIKLNQQQGHLKIEPIKGNAYGGKYLGHIRIDARRQNGNNPLISANESLTKVNIGPVIQAISGKDALTGTGNVSAVLTTRGQSIAALKQSLNGEIKLSLTDGILKNIDMIKTINDTYAKHKNKQTTTTTTKNETPFTSMRISFQVRNGVMHSQDLVLNTPLPPVPLIRGVGSINLNNNTLDYNLKTSANQELISLIGLDKKLVGLPITARFYNDLANPSYSINWGKIIGRALEKSIIKKKKDDLLKGLLGKKKKKPATNPTPVAPAPTTQQAPAKPETREERKKRKKREKEEKIKNLLKGFF